MVKWAVAQVKISKFSEKYFCNGFSNMIWFCAKFQISYADMLKKVEPLREELRSLELQAAENKAKEEETKALIAQLEKSISAYKEEYALLISQATTIKADLENVQAKVQYLRKLFFFSLQETHFQTILLVSRSIDRSLF
jgi:predicted nuclease with TOPRIM domain